MPRNARKGRRRVAWWQCAALAVFAATLALSSTVGSAADRVIDTETGKIKVQTLATGLKRPWGLAFLPDGRMLVTERAGNLRIMATDGTLSEPLTGVPKVEVIGHGSILGEDSHRPSRFVQNSFQCTSSAKMRQKGL